MAVNPKTGLDDPNYDPNADPESQNYGTGKQAPVQTVPGLETQGAVKPDPNLGITPPAPAPVVQPAPTPPAPAPEPPPQTNPVQDVIQQQASALSDYGSIKQANGGPGGPIIALPQTPEAANTALFQQKLAELMGRSLTPQATDPEIAAPLAAERLSEARNTAAQRAFLEEKNAASGTNLSGGDVTGNQGILEDSAARQGTFAGNLYEKAATDRINQLQQTLALEGNQLSNEQRLALEKELSQLQLAQSDSHFNTSNALQLGEFNATQNSQAMQLLAQLLSAGGS